MNERPDATARVIGQHKGRYALATGGEVLLASVAGRLRHESRGPADMPAVGDRVTVSIEGPTAAVIQTVQPRSTLLRRRDTGAHDGQILAANVDDAFIVVPLHRDVTPLQLRIQQYVALVRDCGAAPVLLLTKADLCPDVAAQAARASRAAPGVDVIVTSTLTGQGVAEVARRLAPGRTGVLLGPSGAGKSSLINALSGAALGTREIGGLGEGRHASVRRELVVLPGGGAVIDTPGLREVDAWLSDAAVAEAYPDVAALAGRCRFRDCRHLQEPGCAVRVGVTSGQLDPLRLEGMQALQTASERMRKTAVEIRRKHREIGRAPRRAARERSKDGGAPDA